MINFAKLSPVEKRSIIKRIKKEGSAENIIYKEKKVIFDNTVVVGFVCTNNQCNTFNKYNVHPSSLPFLADKNPCGKCNSDTYLKFVMEDKFEKNVGKYLKTKGTILEYFMDENINNLEVE